MHLKVVGDAHDCLLGAGEVEGWSRGTRAVDLHVLPEYRRHSLLVACRGTLSYDPLSPCFMIRLLGVLGSLTPTCVSLL
jgi:hypothetical protein